MDKVDATSAAPACPSCGAPLTDATNGVCIRCALQDTVEHFKESEAMGRAGLTLHDIPRPGEEHGRIGKYVLEELIGSGGMGVVYRARDPDLNRTVAIKTHLGGRFAPPTFNLRFRQEAESAARLDHPNIVRVHAFGEEDGQPYLVMEYVPGRTLTELAVEWLGEPTRSAALVKTLAEAIHHAHQRGVLHRDLKPANVLVDLDGNPRITDFGLARALTDITGLTQTGHWVGSPSYLAPEQLGPQPTPQDARTDVYGLGAILYHMLTGRPPFVGKSISELLRCVQEERPVPPHELNPLVPEKLERICLKCLEKAPDDRYATALDLAADLERFLQELPVKAERPPLWRRVARRIKRQPGWALSFALLSVLTVSAISANWFLIRRVYEETRAQARRDAEAAEKQMWKEYGEKVQAALESIQGHDIQRAAELLASTTPRRRGWEYDWLHWRTVQRHVVWIDRERTKHGLSCMAVNAKRTMVVAGSRGGEVWLRELPSGRVLARVEHRSEVYATRSNHLYSVEFSPDGREVIAACKDGSVDIMQVPSLELVRRLSAHTGRVGAATFIGDGRQCVTAAEDGFVRFWDTASGSLVKEVLPGGPSEPEGIQTLVGNGRGLIAAGGVKSSVWILSETNGTVLRQWRIGSGLVRALAWDPEGRHLAVAASDGDLGIWDATAGRRIRSLARDPGESWLTYSLGWSPDGELVAGGCHDGCVRIWDVATGRLVERLAGHTGLVAAVEFLGDQAHVLSAGYDGTLRRWTVFTVVGRSDFRTQPEERTTCIALSPQAPVLVRGDAQGIVTAHAIPGWEVRSRFLAHADRITAMALDSQGRRLVTAGRDGRLRLWDMASGSLKFELRSGGEIIRNIAFSPDDQWIGVGGDVRLTQIWDASRGVLLRSLQHPAGPVDRVIRLAFSHSGKYLVVAGLRGRLGLWEVPTGTWRGLLGTPVAGRVIRALAMTPDDRLLAGDSSGRVTIWQLEPIRMLGSFQAHQAVVTGLAVSPDGERWFSAGTDGAIHVWCSQPGLRLLRVPSGAPALWQLRLSHDGKILAAMADDGTVTLYGPGI